MITTRLYRLNCYLLLSEEVHAEAGYMCSLIDQKSIKALIICLSDDDGLVQRSIDTLFLYFAQGHDIPLNIGYICEGCQCQKTSQKLDWHVLLAFNNS